MKRSIYTFDGITPAIDDHLTKVGAAIRAIDCDLRRGGIHAVNNDAAVATPSKLGIKRSIYKFGKDIAADGQFWFHWINDTDVTRGPVANDVQERTYYTEAGQPPKVTDNSIALAGAAYPFTSYLLGLPSPAKAAVSVSGTATPSTTSVQSIVLYTFVTGWGEEGPPSIASDLFTIFPGQTLNVSGLDAAPTGAYNVVSVRLYIVSVTSDGSGAAKFWKALAIGTGGTSGPVSYASLQETLEQPYQLAPPTTGFGIISHPNKFLIMFDKNMVCRSEVNRPHGWPQQYRDPMDSDIVGGCMIGSATVICTKKSTIIGESSDPLNYSFVTLESLRQVCVSKRSIIATDSGVAYASAAGLVIVDPNRGGSVVTKDALTEEQWRAYAPQSMMCVFFDGTVFAFFDTGVRQGCLEIDLARSKITESTTFATAAHAVPSLRALYLQVGNDIVKWKAGATKRTLIWGSPNRPLDRLRGFGAARVIADSYPVTYRQYMDVPDASGAVTNTLVHTQVAVSRKSFAVAPVKGYAWRIEVEGGDGIRGVELASDRTELLSQG
jgi:hypothetical protein